MAQRQFRSDDTDKWKLGFGDGSYGNTTVSSSRDSNVTSGAFTDWGNKYGSVTSATSGNYTATVTDVWGWSTSYITVPVIVIIHQTRGTNAGAWELNQVISGVTSGAGQTITFKYPLQNSYSTSGANIAQIITLTQFNNFTLNSGITLTIPAWNSSSYGGILPILAKGTVTIAGTISGTGRGYDGGTGAPNASVQTGEGHSHAIMTETRTTGGSGGGAHQDDAGGGGGHAAAGSNSTDAGPSSGGTLAGNAGLTSLVLGGGGGGGSAGAGSGHGGNGGASVIIIATDISITGAVTLNANSGTSGGGGRGGGGGAGGACLLKGQTIAIGTNKITVAAGSGGGGSEGSGGAGSVGRIHADYKTSFSGSTSPTIDTRQDSTIAPIPKGAYFHMSV